MRKNKQSGFILIIALVMLAVVTILVVNGMRGTTMNEKMAGNYMERNRAYQAAEQGLRQGSALLQANAETCADGCNSMSVVGVADAVTAMPTAWSDTNSAEATLASGQKSSARYLINRLPNTLLPADKLASACAAYSILARGQGADSSSVVVLQTTAFICPL
ncbi:PilX N-terminal domain-containing pilus assembly protein [Deefgea sp. CFH1-16]|uniref:pilus assembly PilX family protein n=1 Tax=Deefgea sp. CFH1-16 TaxID=2675457 RepID=UPI0015F5F5CE|nr:PilX N-terminal domain-containing pilus assembly protein [Deefgea sp. CFH1-16]MBM5574228.1 hypothetical protein [Deefgea sp. CFH1-16]